MNRIPLCLFSLALLSCGEDTKDDTGPVGPADADRDGYTTVLDCDDADPDVHPGAEERCNLVDDDCDGVVDDNPVDGDTWYLDADHDGYGDPDASQRACLAPTGYVAQAGDCNDASAAVNPAATERCDTRDNDCDGFVDESDAEDAATWYLDADRDGYGDPGAAVPGCSAPTGAVADGTDCDDTDPTVYPGATETWYDGVDSDCAGDDDLDADADGDRALGFGGGDCDDSDPTIHSFAVEVYYDGVDQDCDGLSDYDADVDGYDSDAWGGTDCDDTNPAIYPGAPEVDAGVDNDCDGEAELMPEVDATVDPASALTHCQALTLDGTASYDPDGTPLTYAWEVLGHPRGSTTGTSDFDDPTSATPTIYPDLPGDYDFSLTVTDEGDASATALLTVTIGTRTSNHYPVADAGADQSASATATCAAVGWGYTGEFTCDPCDDLVVALDGTGSSDLDADPLGYLWTVTSGTGSLRLASTDAPTLTITGPTPEYGATTTETVTVEVQVTDCFGDVSTDSVVVTYECTGG